jgi:hypothetical protein
MGPELKRRGLLPRLVAASLIALMAGVLLLKSCAPDSGPKPPAPAEKPQPSLPPTPQVNADSLLAYVKRQVDFGPRVPGSGAHKACADWIVATLHRYGADTVIEQTGTVKAFNGKELPLRNIVAQFHRDRKERVLLMAHYDTRPMADKDRNATRQGDPIPGANDGGSGVAVLLELARTLGGHAPGAVGFDLFFTDVEDYGQPTGAITSEESSDTWCLGAQYWAKNPVPKGYTARFGILFDMVGGRDARFHKEAYSMQSAGAVVNKVWRTAAATGHGDRFVNEVKYFVGIDDHVFVNKGLGIPVIDIIEYNPGTNAFNPTWHTHDDALENIDPATLRAVAQTAAEVLWRER